MVDAQTIFCVSVQLASMATMALALLAFPFISLILEMATGRIKLSSLSVHDLIGFVLIAAGYLLYV